MNISDWLESISLAAVAITLAINAVQSRQALRQTKLLAIQSKSLQDTLEQSAYQALDAGHNTYRVSFFKDDPEMLTWYLSNRGYPYSSHQLNRRTLYLQVKLDDHEQNFINHKKGLLSDDIWDAWAEVIRADVKLPGFDIMWPNARRFYARSFVEYVDALLQTLEEPPSPSWSDTPD